MYIGVSRGVFRHFYVDLEGKLYCLGNYFESKLKKVQKQACFESKGVKTQSNTVFMVIYPWI